MMKFSGLDCQTHSLILLRNVKMPTIAGSFNTYGQENFQFQLSELSLEKLFKLEILLSLVFNEN